MYSGTGLFDSHRGDVAADKRSADDGPAVAGALTVFDPGEGTVHGYDGPATQFAGTWWRPGDTVADVRAHATSPPRSSYACTASPIFDTRAEVSAATMPASGL